MRATLSIRRPSFDPADYFDPINVSIHGLDEETVAGAPTFATVGRRHAEALRGRVAVCHTPFDRLAKFGVLVIAVQPDRLT